MSCHCGNQTDYSQCCEPLILGKQNPATAEALMRSRYTAHVVGAVRYLHDSLTKGARKNFDEAGTRKWSADAEWLGLEILSTTAGQATDTEGTVSFLAKYKMGPKTNRQLIEHRETSTFVRETTDAVWKFSSGKVTGQADEEESAPVVREPAVRDPSKVGRNDPCPCGSGKKYKKCHAQLSA